MISIPQLLIIAVIIALLFGTKRLRGLGSDLGEAIKGFKKSIKDDETKKNNEGHKELPASNRDDIHSSLQTDELKKDNLTNDNEIKGKDNL